MAALQKSSSMLLFFILLGGIVGGVLSEILGRISSAGFIHDIFLKGFKIGLSPPITIDLHMLTFSLGFTVEVNLLTALGVILGIYTFKQA